MHPSDCCCIKCLVAKAARASVPDEQVRRVLQRAEEIRRERATSETDESEGDRALATPPAAAEEER